MQTFIANIRSEHFWIRLGIMLIYALVLEIILPVLLILVILQWVYYLFAGERQPKLYTFSASMVQFLSQIFSYLIYQTERKPFPFQDWPQGQSTQENSTQENSPS